MRFLPALLPLLLAAAPAAAQTTLCAGISLVGEWVGGDEAGSDLAAPDALFEGEGRVPIAGHLVRMFTLSEAARLRIEVRALPAGDPYIAVLDAAGTTVAEDDDSLSDLGSRIDAEFEPGTYCLAIRSYEAGMTDVAFAVGQAGAMDGGEIPDPGAGADLPASAGAGCFEAETPSLGVGLDTTAILAGTARTATAEAAPAYAFDLAEPATLTVTATSETGDPLIRLLDAERVVVAENDDAVGLNSRIERMEPLPAGAYCLEVEDLNGPGNDITVSLSGFDPAADRARRLALAEIAPETSDAVKVTELATLDGVLLADATLVDGARWFRFELPTGGLVLFEAIGDGVDPVVTLFDRAGRRLGENDDGPGGLDSLLIQRLLPGTYLVAVRSASGLTATGGVRLLMERYVPAE